MKLLPATLLIWLGGSFCPVLTAADESAPASVERGQTSDDRLILSANGSKLTGSSGGGGGAVGWLRDLSPGTLVGAGVEYQTIADAHWTVGSLRGSLTRGAESNARWTLFGEIYEGSGRIDARSFTYSIVAAGVSRTVTRGLTLQLEDRQIDIDTTHGNLPKLGLAYLWNPRLLTEVSYARSVGGNLGTELVAARIDYYAQSLHFLGGGAWGETAPAVVNLQTAPAQPGRPLRQLFFGLSRSFSRVELMLVGDHLDSAGSERATLTLSCTIHLRARGASP